MYDRKTVRRRRAVLGLLVAGALILLTAYFGESSGGGLHSVQRGVFSIVSPIQDGASRALKPFRDLVGWVGDTFNAKGEVADLRKERNALRTQVAAGKAAQTENARLTNLLGMDTNNGLKANDPVTARISGFSPTVWSHTVNIDVGTSDGVQDGMPVINDAGLVGEVRQATSGASQVLLITDSSFSVGVRTDSGVLGVASPAVGNPNDLLLNFTRRQDKIAVGQFVATSGTLDSSRLTESAYPPGILVGTVTKVDDPGQETQVAHVKPAADVGQLEYVQVLRKRVNGNRGTP